ncbi:MAG: GFA family protein [Gammaproteobacteria bacterium]|nr:GFA family protein [Gammaproteobacteria bacterium]MDH5691678.1 GFA family protein [Gammaproteobacteria bacterium]
MKPTEHNMQDYSGGCHCGAVRYSVKAPQNLDVVECNCSICSKSGYLHLIINKEKFHLIQGKEQLSLYTFDTHEAKHYFCNICGIKSFYIPRSHPDGISVNVRCLDNFYDLNVTLTQFDGQNWEESIESLRNTHE